MPASYDAFSYPPHGLPTSQGSPDPAIAHTPMPVGSVDSGIGGDVDDARTNRTRSSSEEKEPGLTPAQSKRKAQNRAAYVSPSCPLPAPSPNRSRRQAPWSPSKSHGRSSC